MQIDYAGRDWQLWALDLTHDLGTLTCAALAHQPAADRFVIGLGCHLDGHLAVQHLPNPGGTDLRADIEYCMTCLHKADLELLVVDKTRPDIGLSVAQATVPHLGHIWPRFGPGRLYQVPFELGWISAPKAENDLNPVYWSLSREIDKTS